MDALNYAGRTKEATILFERLLALRNDVGLLSEEWDPVTRRQLGNTPQAFSHFALVVSALQLGHEHPHRSDQPIHPAASSPGRAAVPGQELTAWTAQSAAVLQVGLEVGEGGGGAFFVGSVEDCLAFAPGGDDTAAAEEVELL